MVTEVGSETSSVYSPIPYPLCQAVEGQKDLETSSSDYSSTQTPRVPPATCFGKLVRQFLPKGLGDVEVVVVLIDALEEQWDVLEDDDMLALLLPSSAQLLVQPLVLGLLQGRAPGGIIKELGVEDEEEDAPNPEAEIVISPSLLELCDGLRGGGVAHVMVAADQDQWDLAVHIPEHPLQVLRLLLPPGCPWKGGSHPLMARLFMHLLTK